MLIIAIPKSASTSLMRTLASLYTKKGVQKMKGKRVKCKNYPLLGKYHSDIRDIESSDILNERFVQKQHYPPTPHNRKILKNVKKIILLRSPLEVIEAYQRAHIKKLHKPKEEFSRCSTSEEWVHQAKEIGLYEEVKQFYEGWKEVSDSLTLTITYEELVDSPKSIFRKIADFYHLPFKPKATLSKARYSRS